MNRQIWLYAGVVILLLIWGCGPKMMVPPAIDLNEYGGIGLINFSSNAEGSLDEFVTQKFLAAISPSQKGARIIELGSESTVLESVKQDRMGPEALQAIGQKYNVTTIIMGNLEISDVKPKVRLSSVLTSMSVKADVEALITAKLLETEDGATLWTNTVQDKKTVASVSIFSGGVAHFDASDPEEAYGDLVEGLIKKVTEDLRVTYKRM